MNYIISIEGQTIPVPEEIGKDDSAVKKALAPFYPQVANAMITRTTKDDTITVNVVKQAGTKGGYSVFDVLSSCPAGQNSAIELYRELSSLPDSALDPQALLELDARLEQAIQAGEEESKMVDKALERLHKARAVPASLVVEGF